MLRAIGMGRNADDQLDRFPFLDQGRNGCKPGAIVLGTDSGERMRDAERQVAERNANAFFAKIECQHGSGSGAAGEGGTRGFHGWHDVRNAMHCASPVTAFRSLALGVARLLGKAGVVDAEQIHRRRQPFFRRQFEDDFRRGVDREPGVL